MGHDIFSQLVWGTRASLVVAVAASVLAVAVAVVIGAGCGLIGGWVDRLAMRLLDAGLALPVLPLMVLVASLVGPGRVTTIVVIGLLIWPLPARLLHAETLSVRQRGYVASARGFGGGVFHLLRRHLLPALAPLVAVGLIRVGSIALVLDAGLAFLGVADPLGVSWGLMLNHALTRTASYADVWTWWVPPTMAISLAVLGFTFVGVGLEPEFNPRSVPRAPE